METSPDRNDNARTGRPDAAEILEHLGVLYTLQAKFEAAETHHLRALDIRRSRLGPGHILAAQSLETYAQLLIRTGRGAEAKRAQTEAAAIRAGSTEAGGPKPGESGDRRKPAVHRLKLQN